MASMLLEKVLTKYQKFLLKRGYYLLKVYFFDLPQAKKGKKGKLSIFQFS
jgi:CRISPR/Cas system-associated protein endoribonuclease Cas2